MKRHIPPIRGRLVRLRLLEENDIETTRNWRNQDNIRGRFFDSRVISAGQQAQWFASYRDRDDDFVFVIEEAASLRPVGQCAIYKVDWACGRGEFGRLMIGDQASAGKGLAREATGLLVDYALGEMGLDEVCLEVFADNVQALAIYKKSGFEFRRIREGVVSMIRRRPE